MIKFFFNFLNKSSEALRSSRTTSCNSVKKDFFLKNALNGNIILWFKSMKNDEQKSMKSLTVYTFDIQKFFVLYVEYIKNNNFKAIDALNKIKMIIKTFRNSHFSQSGICKSGGDEAIVVDSLKTVVNFAELFTKWICNPLVINKLFKIYTTPLYNISKNDFVFFREFVFFFNFFD